MHTADLLQSAPVPASLWCPPGRVSAARGGGGSVPAAGGRGVRTDPPFVSGAFPGPPGAQAGQGARAGNSLGPRAAAPAAWLAPGPSWRAYCVESLSLCRACVQPLSVMHCTTYCVQAPRQPKCKTYCVQSHCSCIIYCVPLLSAFGMQKSTLCNRRTNAGPTECSPLMLAKPPVFSSWLLKKHAPEHGRTYCVQSLSTFSI